MSDQPGPTPVRSGILNIDKPDGVSSHDVVNSIRRIVGMRRIGHAGTLDPDANGVLLVCLGSATRVSEYLMDTTKEYRATIRFGEVSTTDDRSGEITVVRSVAQLADTEILQPIPRFVGEIQQVPPVYSAIKVSGQPLYKRARQGQTVIPAARLVRIYRITVVSWSCPDLTVDVTCAKGTYIRSLARDWGEAVGTGAYLRALSRTRSGQFGIEDSLSIGQVAQAHRLGYLHRLLYPIDTALSTWPAVFLTSDDVRRITSGLGWQGPPPITLDRVRAYDSSTGRLVGLLHFDQQAGHWQPERVFAGVVDDAA
ncbi:MAG TPA: tRNA pseudouridine(55) synthase TruB [Chloroflexota bacterium]|nr:tRNA pseudouridine(55) synthase TruB [Chloroflexota bacterium]